MDPGHGDASQIRSRRMTSTAVCTNSETRACPTTSSTFNARTYPLPARLGGGARCGLGSSRVISFSGPAHGAACHLYLRMGPPSNAGQRDWVEAGPAALFRPSWLPRGVDPGSGDGASGANEPTQPSAHHKAPGGIRTRGRTCGAGVSASASEGVERPLETPPAPGSP